MEKQPGWGEAYPDDKRNGDWDYAWFDAEGTLKHSDPARYEGCFSCHQSRAGRDYTFTSFKNVVAGGGEPPSAAARDQLAARGEEGGERRGQTVGRAGGRQVGEEGG